ncbi:MAG: hypothetical protein ABW221_08520 [Vicinamibacteria bacterium]
MVALRPEVAEALGRHGVVITPNDTAETLRDKLNDAYLVAVRLIRERQRHGEIARPDYAKHVQALRDEYSLLSLPLPLWTTPADPG